MGLLPTYNNSSYKYNSSLGPYGELIVGNQRFSPKQVFDYFNTVSPEEASSTVMQYGVNPAHVLQSYNIASPTDVSPGEASAWLGLDVPQGSTNQEALNQIYNLINETVTNQQQQWQSMLDNVLGSINAWSSQAAAMNDPAYLQKLLSQAMSASEGPMQQARNKGTESLYQAYLGNVAQVLNNLAARGIINSNLTGQALAQLGSSYLQGVGSLENALLGQYAPNIGALSDLMARQTQANQQVPAMMLNLLSQTPQYDLTSLGTMLGLFDLMGQAFV